jgi:CRP-like cAMP-binding protein
MTMTLTRADAGSSRSIRSTMDGSTNTADSFAEEVILAGGRVRLRSLLSDPPPGTLYHQPDRHGIAVVAVPAVNLTAEDTAGLLRFRFAQYLDIGFVDRQFALSQGMRTEPVSVVTPGDLHVVTGVPATGEILCYAVIEQPPSVPPGCRLRSEQRELFPVERVHGAGVFNRLPILPDLSAAKVREMGRFVRNQRPSAERDQVTRAVVETGVAIFRLMAGPLRLHVDAVVGDLEEHVAKQNLDFFHVPSVVMHGTVPYAGSASYLSPRYRLHTVYPFACLTSDIATALPRLDAVERALAKPGKRGLLALLWLRSHGAPAASMLCPAQQADLVGELSLAQHQTSMTERSTLLRQGAWLRQLAPFSGLSVAEAALLCSQMQQIEIEAGEVITRQGEVGEALYVIQRGYATVEMTDSGGASRCIGSLGPGECCGHVTVLTGVEHPVNVIATSDMTVLRLSKDTHDIYLAQLPDVGHRLGHDALRLLAEVDKLHRATPTTEGCGCGPDCACLGHNHDDDPEATQRGVEQP